MKTLSRYIGYRTLKTAFGAAIAIYIAYQINLSYAVSAGIILVLSVQNTKRKSLDLAIMRIGSTVLALLTAAAVFLIMGYTPWAFGVYLLIFIPLAVRMRFNDGIVPSSVLVTHLLLEESVSLAWMTNEMLIMGIGAGLALILNIYMPSFEKALSEDLAEIERLMKDILMRMAYSLRTQTVSVEDQAVYQTLERKLKEGHDRALTEAGNHLIREVRYYVKYMEMRSMQFEILKFMRLHFERFSQTYEQTKMVAAFTELVADQFHELNTVKELIADLKAYKAMFRSMELPKTREEFENRASLYQYLNDLDHLLEVKRSFVEELSEADRKRFREDLEENRKLA
jgi:uncharacterized membrane protein YgaE (UPF0421/DUF939 family)